MKGRRVTLFEQRPAADRRLGTVHSQWEDAPSRHEGSWGVYVKAARNGDRMYAKVSREVHDEFVCRAARSGTLTYPDPVDTTRHGTGHGLAVHRRRSVAIEADRDQVLDSAPRAGVSVASVNYGGATREVERALPDVCPIVGSFGARDRWPGMRTVPERLERMLSEVGVEHDIKVYPDAGHGFLNDHDPAELPVWVKGIAALARAEYHDPSAQDARRRIVAFFGAHLKS